MKKTLIIGFLLVAFAVWLSDCNMPPQNNQATAQISVANSFTNRMEHGLIHKISQVAGFEHQYDTTFLLVSNETSGQQFRLVDPFDPIFGNIALSVAPHNFFMESRKAGNVSEFLEFTAASGTGIQINPGVNQIQLEMESKQGLILVDTTGIENWPSCQVGPVPVPMSLYKGWYYSYVKAEAVITFQSDGGTKQKLVPFLKEWIQTYSPATGEVRVTDSFQNVKQI